MKNLQLAAFLLLQVLLLSDSCTANKDTQDAKSLARMLLSRFAESPSSKSKNGLGFLRKLVDRKTADEDERAQEAEARKREFGPGADWSCTKEANLATDYDSCTMSEASKTTEGGCSWCPLGSKEGVCLRAGQASIINGLGNQHLLHLHCYNDAESVINEEATQFWDEALACLPHHRDSCGGDHGEGDHVCTYCSIKEPAMGMCLSVSLWDNLVVAQALEDFDQDVSTGDQIRLDQVVHCNEDGIDSTLDDDSIIDNFCGGAIVNDVKSEEECFTKEGCAIAPNIFPGFLGMESGMHCVGVVKERATQWAVGVLKDMGWVEEMNEYQ